MKTKARYLPVCRIALYAALFVLTGVIQNTFLGGLRVPVLPLVPLTVAVSLGSAFAKFLDASTALTMTALGSTFSFASASPMVESDSYFAFKVVSPTERMVTLPFSSTFATDGSLLS